MKADRSISEKLSDVFVTVESELREGMAQLKCRRCGCMKEELEQVLSLPQTPEVLKNSAKAWLEEMEPIRYSCLGCNYCFPAVAANIVATALPHQIQGPTCGFLMINEWPPVAGEYFVLDSSAEIAISTLGSPELAHAITQARIPGICMVGKTETENIGIDKVIKNTITNPAIRILLLVGSDPRGHLPGATMVALAENGIDENQRVVGSPARRPFLRNVTQQEVEAFRKQITVVNRIGITEPEHIVSAVAELHQDPSTQKGCCSSERKEQVSISSVGIVEAEEPQAIEMDRAGYFVIIPDHAAKRIHVEHYSYEDRLLRIIKGATSRSVYWTLIKNGWVSQLSHAAYVGKELTRAELSLQLDIPYVQDGA